MPPGKWQRRGETIMLSYQVIENGKPLLPKVGSGNSIRPRGTRHCKTAPRHTIKETHWLAISTPTIIAPFALS